VAIDGYGGAGKTTLARAIQSEFLGSQIITLDDFETDTTSGADRKRFVADVLEPLVVKSFAKYQPFSWKNKMIMDWIEVKPHGVILLEGVSVLGQDFYSYYDLRIWINCPFELAQERMQGRERKAEHVSTLSHWFNVWEKEDKDYGLTEPWKRADIIVPID
jgi:uridine kinase